MGVSRLGSRFFLCVELQSIGAEGEQPGWKRSRLRANEQIAALDLVIGWGIGSDPVGGLRFVVAEWYQRCRYTYITIHMGSTETLNLTFHLLLFPIPFEPERTCFSSELGLADR